MNDAAPPPGNPLAGFELIVHIGTGKTGSSSIQKSLSASGEALRRHGVAYLGMMFEESPVRRYDWQRAGAWPQLRALGPELAQQQMREVLDETLARVAAHGARRAIWSNETLYGNHLLAVPLLAALQARGVKVRIVVYLRRHDAWARSAYLQWGIKHKTNPGPIQPFAQWCEKHRVAFYEGLKPWLDAPWSATSVRNYDAAGDVLVDFLSCLGLPPGEFAQLRENETPHPVALALWALFNDQVPQPILPAVLQRTLQQGGVLDKAPRDTDFAALLPSQKDLDAVRKAARADRARLDALLRAHGQPPIDTAPLKVAPVEVSQNQINAALLLMIKRQQDQIDALRKRLDARPAARKPAKTGQ